MATLKTQPNDADVDAFLDAVDHDTRREDAQRVCQMMREITGLPAKMWGKSIVGFGSYHYVYDSGREGDWFRVGFSPRKRNLTLYIMPGFGAFEDLLSRLGKHKLGKSCLYVNKLADVDEGVLRELIEASLVHMEKKYGPQA